MSKKEDGVFMGSQPTSERNRVIRVFVSSTFRDMVEDRNGLMSQAWPALRKLCRGKGVEFVEVDLRWGITEEMSQRKETVRHCLAEIKRCRPYFIGLLGERYGWVPESEAYPQALLDEENWLAHDVAKRSITEIEIYQGVLNDPDLAKRAFFYFRDPAYAQDLGGDYQAENAVNANRQKVLKEMIRSVCQAKGIPLREGDLYTNPRQLAALVLTDLSTAIEAEFPADHVLDVWTREDRDHEAFAKSRRTDFYVGRDAYFKQLDTFARNGADVRGMIILGESGGGKSALLANWISRWRQAHSDDFVFQHFIGSSPMSAGHLALMRRLMVAIVRWCAAVGIHIDLRSEEENIPSKTEEIVKVFPEYLDRLAFQAKEKGVHGVIVLDALNQLEDRERGRLLAWLPEHLPSELRLVVSTLPGDTLDSLATRSWSTLTVEPLSATERVQLIARYLAHFSQGLSEIRAQKIAATPAAVNPLYLKILLDDLRATGAHERLDAQISDYLQAADIPALLGKILARYERDYERDRPGLVREALSLLWAAHRGLTEPELLEVLKPVELERLPTAFWLPVRCALEDGLVDRDGVLAFAHNHMRAAVERRYVADAGVAKALRLRLAGAFNGRPMDARQADELPWLLRQAEDRERLKTCLLETDRFLLIRDRDQNELLAYWVWLKEEQVMGKAYLKSFELWSHQPGLQDQRLSAAANSLAIFLHHASLYAETEPLYRRALAIYEKSFGKDHPNVAVCLNNLAQLLQDTNRLAEAEPLMRRAITINETSFGKNHPGMATVINNLAQLLKYTNQLSEAEPLMRRALAIWKQSYGDDHPNVALALSNLAGLLQDTNRLAEAESLMRQALAIYETSLGKDHPEVGREVSQLAGLLKDTNRLAEAELLIRRALAISEQSFGENHPHVASTLNNLAQLLMDTNRLAEAEPLFRRALAIDEMSFGKDHPDVATVLNNLALLLKDTNRLAEAELLLRRILAIYETSFGEDHPYVAIALNNLAQMLQATNKPDEAEPLYHQALAIWKKSYGEDHPDVASALYNLATLLHATHRQAEAEPLMRRAIEIFLSFARATGHPHPQMETIANYYVKLLRAMGRSWEEINAVISAMAPELFQG